MPEDEVGAEGVVDEVVTSEEPGWVNPTDTSGEVATESTAPSTYTVKVDGEEVQVSLEEALQGYQRQADYTRKTQEVAQQREELEYAARLAAALETNPTQTIEALQQAYAAQLGQPQATPAAAEPLDPEEARYATLESRIAAQEQAAFEQQINTQLASLHTQYGQFDDVELMTFAVQRNIPDLGDAAKVFVFDKVMQKATADRTAQANKDAAPPVAGGRGVSSGAVVPGAQVEKPTVREAIEAAMRAHS